MRLILRQGEKCYSYKPQNQNELVDAPESGPGYQLLRFAGNSAPVGDYIAFNAEFLVPVEVVHDDLWGALTDWPSADTFDEYKSLFPTPQILLTLPSHVPIPGTGVAGSPRSTLLVKGAGTERFWRFSAFSPDRRISSSGAVVLGTYLVSDNDKDFIETGLGAVGRCALPLPFPAIYRYELNPTRSINLSYTAGTVRPAFGQSGGGVEAVLSAAAPPGTVAAPASPHRLPIL